MNEKVYILYDFGQGSGGGKSFLSNLRDHLRERNLYAESAEEAEIILLNSHNHLERALEFKKLYGGIKSFLHRIDGPMRLYNHKYDFRDYEVKFILENISDGVIFQSQWSYESHVQMYGKLRIPHRIIHNAANKDIFYPKNKSQGDKLKIVATSWSHQVNKGGDFYSYLDDHLDFNKFEMTFIGKTSHQLKNIKCLGVLDQKSLANSLREYDIFFFPSRFEACSNALLEGIGSGLIPIVRAGSSNLEIVPDQRLQFSNYDEALRKLEAVDLRTTYNYLNPNIESVANNYYSFAQDLETHTITNQILLHKFLLKLAGLKCKSGNFLRRKL